MDETSRIRAVFVVAAAGFVLLLLCGEAAQAQDVSQYELGTTVRLVLIDGTVHVGQISAVEDSTVVLEGAGGVRTTIPIDQIRRIESLDGLRFQETDPNLTRLFFSPTARPLAHGNVYVAVYELFFPFVAVGLRDVITLAGGISIVPALGTQAVYVAPKATLYARDNMGIAIGGLLGSNTGFDTAAGLLFGIGTFGRPDAAVTVGTGFGFFEGEFSTRPILLIAGEYQVSNSVKLISENFVVPGYGDAILASGGIRFFGRRLAADIGLITTPVQLTDAEGFPFVPWLGFAYNFGSD